MEYKKKLFRAIILNYFKNVLNYKIMWNTSYTFLLHILHTIMHKV